MLAVESKSSSPGSAPSRPLPLESGEFMHSREFLRGLPEYERRTRLTEDGYPTGLPEMPVEVAPSSAGVDVRDKRRACCRNRVREYQFWLVAEARPSTNFYHNHWKQAELVT